MSAGDGGAAFPQTVRGWNDHMSGFEQRGMSLRDWFAGQALMVAIPQIAAAMDGRFSDVDMARMAFAIADAMLKERDSERERGR